MTENQHIKQLPKDWKWVKLGEVCHTTSGGTPSRRVSKYYGGNIPWVKSGELNKGIITDTEEKISEEAIKNSSAKIFPKGTLLIALYGATIGKLAFLGIDAATNQAICGIYQNEDISSSFLYNYLAYKKRKLVGQGIGGAQPNISQTILKDLDLPLPPLPTQLAIVSKIEELFSELDKGIENLRLAQQQLKTYKQSVLKWAFEGKLSEAGFTRLKNEQDVVQKEILQSSNSENSDFEKWELPEGWKWVLINELGRIKGGKRLPPKHQYSEEPTDYVYIMAGNLKNGSVRNKPTFIREETYNALANYKVTGGEVYITIVGACIGDAGIIPENIGKSILTENAAKIIDLKETYNKYLALWINSTACQANIKSKILSATLGKLALNRIGTLEVPIAPIKEQHKIVQKIESRLSVADKMEESINQSLQQAEALRQSILKEAFEGRLV